MKKVILLLWLIMSFKYKNSWTMISRFVPDWICSRVLFLLSFSSLYLTYANLNKHKENILKKNPLVVWIQYNEKHQTKTGNMKYFSKFLNEKKLSL